LGAGHRQSWVLSIGTRVAILVILTA